MKNSTQSPIRIVIADDHPMIRNGLANLVRAEPTLQWVGEAANGHEAVHLCRSLSPVPQVVLMDLMMPDLDGASAAQQILKRDPTIRIVMLTSFHEPALVQRAMQAGALGYILKTASAEELIHAIHAAHAGKRVLAPEATSALIEAEQNQNQAVGADLTERERNILQLLAQGLSNQEIAARLFVVVPTVKFHITNIFAKLGVNSRTEAVLLAIKHKLVQP